MRPLENGDLLNSKLLSLIKALEIIFSSLLADFPGNKSEYGVRDILQKKFLLCTYMMIYGVNNESKRNFTPSYKYAICTLINVFNVQYIYFCSYCQLLQIGNMFKKVSRSPPHLCLTFLFSSYFPSELFAFQTPQPSMIFHGVGISQCMLNVAMQFLTFRLTCFNL